MVNIDNVLKSIEEQSKSLAEKLFKQYTQQAFTDIRDFLRKSKADLERWIQELDRGQIDKDEFKSVVQGQLDVAEKKTQIADAFDQIIQLESGKIKPSQVK